MMASAVSAMSPKHRKIASLVAACMLMLLAASPAFAYNEENVKHTRVSRLDPVQCATPIRLVADLTDKRGNAVSGAEVQWSFHKSEPGDTLNPTTTFADAEGRARTTLTLACETGTRIIRAHVPGDGTGQITISCKSSTNCAEDDDDDDKHVMRLTLERLDPISCTNTMRFRAMVYDKNDNPIRDVTVKFDADEKEDGDKLTPKSQKTDSNGGAITYLDMSCEDGAREIVAKADGKQREIKFRCGVSQGCAQDDDRDGENDKDNDLILGPFDRNGGTGQSIPLAGADARAIGSYSPSGWSHSQYVATIVLTALGLAVATRAIRPRGLAIAGLRSPVPA